jgi:hypothetical protein
MTTSPSNLPIAAVDWAFLAGLIEADGCIALIATNQGYFNARVMFANNSEILHDWMATTFKARTKVFNKGSDCTTTHWSDCRDLVWLLEGMLPYLRSKKEEAELLLEYAKGGRGAGVKSLVPLERKCEIYLRMKWLKKNRP